VLPLLDPTEFGRRRIRIFCLGRVYITDRVRTPNRDPLTGASAAAGGVYTSPIGLWPERAGATAV
jgi:hypothetical protein